nr:alpha-ketoacid dehydrogenase subunit beta [Sulfobacillus harzensis]
MARAISEALAQAMENDPRVMVWGEDVGVYGGIFGATQGLYETFGSDRVMDTPISESAFIGAAIGASAEGLRPVVELMFIDFFGVAMDQIYNHLAKNHYMSGGQVRHPVVLMTAIGAGYSDAAQHSQSLYSIFSHVPGLKVAVPSNAYDAKGMMLAAIQDDNPVLYCFHKGLMGLGWMPSDATAEVHVPAEPYTVPLGQARVAAEGQDVSIITIGAMVGKALKARGRLSRDGVSAEVIDLRTLVPLDRATVVDSVMKTHRAVIVDEDYRSYGMSAEIAALLAEEALDYLESPVRRVAVPDVPIPYSRILESTVIPSELAIVEAVRGVMES